MKKKHFCLYIQFVFILFSFTNVNSQNIYGYFGDGAWTDVVNWDAYPGETINPGDTVYIFGNITEGSATIINNGNIENHGSIIFTGTSSFTNTADFTVMSSGSITLNTGANFTNDDGLITNEGTIINDNAVFVNTGASAVLDNDYYSTFINRNMATFINDLDANVSVYGTDASFQNDNSTITNKNLASFFVGTISGVRNMNGSTFDNLSNAGVTTNLGGFVNESSSIFNNEGNVFSSDGGFANLDTAVFNNNQNGQVFVRYFGGFSNRSVFNNNEFATIYVDSDSNFSNILNGVLINNGTVTNDATQYNSATIKGVNVSHTGNLYNSGTLSPGNSVGTYQLTGDYFQVASGTLEIEIEGTGVNYDILQINNASIDGTLVVTLPTMYEPSIGDSFTIITGNSITGTFSNTNFPVLQNKMWNIIYTPTTVRLEVDVALNIQDVATQEGIYIYPNPSKEKLFIKNINSETNRYSIFNVLGQVVTNGTVENNTISLSSLKKGSYYLKLDGHVFSIIKE